MSRDKPTIRKPIFVDTRKWSELNFIMSEFSVFQEIVKLAGYPTNIVGDGTTGYTAHFLYRNNELDIHARRRIVNGAPMFEVSITVLPFIGNLEDEQ